MSPVDILYIALMIGGLIFIHELGHYLLARWTGVHVVEFSIGFGPRLFGFKGKKTHPDLPPTEFIVAALPFGGYVKMLGADPTEDDSPPEIRSVALNYKPIWQRFLVAFAGPAFNLLLPFVLFFFVGLTIATLPPSLMGDVEAGSPAWEAGIRSGDRVVEIAGEPVRHWHEFASLVEAHPGQAIEVALDRLGETHRVTLTPVVSTKEIIPKVWTREVGRAGVGLSFAVPIVAVEPGSQAEAAGLRTWDLIVSVDGTLEPHMSRVLGMVAAHAGRDVRLGVLRYQAREAGFARVGLAEAVEITLPRAEGEPTRGLVSGECVVYSVAPGSPAAGIGLRRGDRLLALDGRPCSSWMFAANYLHGRGTDPVELVLRRDGAELSVTLEQVRVAWPLRLQPEAQRLVHGIETLSAVEAPEPVPVEGRFGFALGYMAERSANAMVGTLAVLGGLFTGRVGVKEGLGGPVLIAAITADAAAQGWSRFFELMALLSVSLGLINLLPIPILDGGQILFLAIEGIRRKPVSMRTRMIATYIGLAFIVVLMVVVLRNDLQRCAFGMIGL